MSLTTPYDFEPRLNSIKGINLLLLTEDESAAAIKYHSLLINPTVSTRLATYDENVDAMIADQTPDLVFLDECFKNSRRDHEIKARFQSKYHIPVITLMMNRIENQVICPDASDLCGYYHQPAGAGAASVYIDLILYHYILNRRLHQKEAFFHSIIKPIAELHLLVDWSGRIQEVLPSANHRAFLPDNYISKNVADLIHQDDVDLFKAMLNDLAEDRKKVSSCKFRAITLGGGYRYLEAHAAITPDDYDGSGIILICYDLSNPVHTLNAYQKYEHSPTWLIDALPVMVYISDLSLNFKFVNKAWTEFTGKYFQEEIEEGWKPDLHPEDLEKFIYLFARAITQRQSFKTEIRIYRFDGEIRWMLITGTLRYDENRIPQEFIGTCIDISEYKNIEESLYYLASHDSLTGLYNRSFYEEEMTRFEKSSRFPISIVVADIDGMKLANDTFGHRAGDELLRRSARVLLETFRSEDIIARIGGDEFAILLPDTEEEVALEAIGRVRSSLRGQIREYPEFPLRLSMGAATTNKELSLNEALIVADRRMYNDKLLKR
jgi:diguanylate cyclase (GGDEF)-like protein/PAS domain S-box-containing protein